MIPRQAQKRLLSPGELNNKMRKNPQLHRSQAPAFAKSRSFSGRGRDQTREALRPAGRTPQELTAVSDASANDPVRRAGHHRDRRTRNKKKGERNFSSAEVRFPFGTCSIQFSSQATGFFRTAAGRPFGLSDDTHSIIAYLDPPVNTFFEILFWSARAWVISVGRPFSLVNLVKRCGVGIPTEKGRLEF